MAAAFPAFADAHRGWRDSPAHANPSLGSLSGAVPANDAAQLPSTSAQYRALQAEVNKARPAVQDAKLKSDTLAGEAAVLRNRLISTAARIQALETEKSRLDAEIANLSQGERSLSKSFVQDRTKVVQLVAVLERLQRDVPPVMAMRPDDALSAARGAMLLGATLPRIYAAAADLARKLELLKRTRSQLLLRQADGTRNAGLLAAAEAELDQLLAMKAREADAAAAQYGDLAAKLEAAAGQAATLEALLRRVAMLRAEPAGPSLVVVAAKNADWAQGPRHGSMLRPVVGRMVAGDAHSGPSKPAPGVSFFSPPGAQVVAPADSAVLFAGPYHKSGQVLILQMSGGYDLVLAGLDRVDVRSGDQLLAGEPIGKMPRIGLETRLYFELRHNGNDVSPAPWLEGDVRKARRS